MLLWPLKEPVYQLDCVVNCDQMEHCATLNNRLELALILERQILEVLSKAEADNYLALCVLRATSAQIESLPSGTRI
jgi:hypothetical protein